MELNNQVEKIILEAAERVFYIKGKDGASMQNIADEAKITRTSLNYYYRSKDKLFEAVFRNTMVQFVPKLAALLASSSSFTEYLPKMVEIIIDTIIEKPQIPVFVLQELTSNPGRVPQLMTEMGIHPAFAMNSMKNDEFLKDIAVDPRHIIINVLSMSIFPFAAKPMLLSMLYNGDQEAYIEAMKQRKVILPAMVENMIKSLKS